MRPATRFGLALLAIGPMAATAQQAPAPAPAPATTPVPAPSAPPPGSHQIDRYEAIRQLQEAARTEPNNVANLIILGELAHEVATELPAEQDMAYYAMSKAAYEKALALEPNNPGLKAAVRFAEEQAANAARFDAGKRAGVAAYLAARRQELGQPGVGPRVRVYEAPAAAPASTPNQPQPAAPGRTLPAAAVPTYRPFYPQGGQAYTYGEYSNSTLPSVSSTAAGMAPRAGASNPASTGGAVKPAAAAAPP